jgi:predicted nuclease with RNAse H fold
VSVPGAPSPAEKTPERFAGIDVGAREYHAVLLSPAADWLASVRLTSAEAVAAWVREAMPDGGVIGIDAPVRTSEGLLQDPDYRAGLLPVPPADRYRTYRVCDYQLARRGLPLYLVPTRYPDCPGWMRAGFAVYDALIVTGCWSLFEGGDPMNRVAEVYPFAAFSVLLGEIPPAKHTPAGRAARLAALIRRGLSPEALEGRSHHELDAAAAALTARALGSSQGTWVGSPREALIVLPGPLKERYRPRRGG